MDKIDPSQYLDSDLDPQDEAVVRAGDWYDEETAFVSEDSEEGLLGWMLAQGWTVLSSTDSGTYLERSKLNTRKALDHLIESYTDKFNEGREINDDRYDDIVALYTAEIDKTEDDLNDLEDDEDAYEDLVNFLINSVNSDIVAHDDDLNEILDDWGDSERDRITRDFANRLAKNKDFLQRTGLYNTTNWTVASDGNERDEAIASTDLEDKILERQLALKDRLYSLRVDVRLKVIAARDRLFSLLQGRGEARLVLRNRIVEILAGFAERRTDSYPDIDKIGDIATNMGVDGSTSGFTP